MSEKTFKVILDNNAKEQTFTVQYDVLNFSSFAELLKISGFVEEISNLCFIDGVFYINPDFTNFNVVNVFSKTFFNHRSIIIPTISQNESSNYDITSVNSQNQSIVPLDLLTEWSNYDITSVDSQNEWTTSLDSQNVTNSQTSRIILQESYDSDYMNPYPHTPRRLVKKVSTPEAPRKRNRREDNGSEVDLEDLDNLNDLGDLYVSIYCVKCFGFDTSHINRIVMCNNRNCSVACHKNCSEQKVFKCDVHSKIQEVRRKLF